METRNNKLYGLYNNEMELQEEMDRLRAQGYADEDMYIVSNQGQSLSMYRGAKSYKNDNEEASLWDRFKAFLMGEDVVRDKYFTEMGFTEEERNRYYTELQAGKYLLYVDRDYGTFFDETTKSFSGMTGDSDVENNYTQTDAHLHDRTGNVDNSLMPDPDNPLRRRDI